MCHQVRKAEYWGMEASSKISSLITSFTCHQHLVFAVPRCHREALQRLTNNHSTSTVKIQLTVLSLYHILLPHSSLPCHQERQERGRRETWGKCQYAEEEKNWGLVKTWTESSSLTSDFSSLETLWGCCESEISWYKHCYRGLLEEILCWFASLSRGQTSGYSPVSWGKRRTGLRSKACHPAEAPSPPASSHEAAQRGHKPCESWHFDIKAVFLPLADKETFHTTLWAPDDRCLWSFSPSCERREEVRDGDQQRPQTWRLTDIIEVVRVGEKI